MGNIENMNINTEEVIDNGDEKTTIGIKTTWKYRHIFNALEGETNEDKYLALLDAYNEKKRREESFNLNSYNEAIQKSFKAITSQINAMEQYINQREQDLKSEYVDDFGLKLESIKETLHTEKELKGKINELENELEIKSDEVTKLKHSSVLKEEIIETLTNEKEKMEEEYKTKVDALETQNTELIRSENTYIKQISDMEKELHIKDEEQRNTITQYEEKFTKLKQEHLDNIKELNVKHNIEISEYKKQINGLDTEKAVLNNTIKNLENNSNTLLGENNRLQEEIKNITKEYKEELKSLEKEHKEELKSLEKEIKTSEDKSNKLEIEKAKLETKTATLEELVKSLQEEKTLLKQQVSSLEETIKTNQDEIQKLNETAKKREVEVERLNNELKKIADSTNKK